MTSGPTASNSAGSDGCELLSLIVPVYNEADNFPALVAEVEQKIPQPFILYMIYDFDEDTTVPVARALAASRPWLRLLKNELGRGAVWAIKAGFQTVNQGPALVIMADLSDDLSIVPEMLSLYRRGFRIVCPSRYMRGGRQVGGPVLKRLMSQTAGLSLYYLVGFPTHDCTNSFRLYDAALVNDLGIQSSGGFELALELTAKAFGRGVRIAELPTTWKGRTSGESRFQLRKWFPKYLYWYGYALAARWRRRSAESP
jgi:glycosyltransferase involved in cell wall biosynthesis